MPAKTGKPKRANSLPWVLAIGSERNREKAGNSGITRAELQQRAVRYEYLKRNNLTFV